MQAIILGLTLLARTHAAGSTVSGVVIDSGGLEVAHALVEAVPMAGNEPEKGGTVGDRPSPWIQADSHGGFSISLRPGRYRIRAKDEADGYPDSIFMMNSDPTARFPEISVGEVDLSGVRVILGKQGGILTGEIVDLVSSSPVPRGKVTFRDARDPRAYVEVFADERGRFLFVVPNKPVLISAGANGYGIAKFAGGAEVALSSGERRSIVLELQHR
jgi:hypothetical protein